MTHLQWNFLMELSKIKDEILNENNPQIQPLIVSLREHRVGSNCLLNDFEENLCEVKPNRQKLYTSILLHSYKKQN